MFDIEREEKILEILKEKHTVRVNTLIDMLYYSGATIRRDLVRMEKKGLVVRTFGAVTLNSLSNNSETSFELREMASISEKRNLACKVVKLIQPNSTIFIDSSSTLFYCVPFLNEVPNLLIITNSLRLANEVLTQTKHSVIIIGGNIQPNTNSVLGSIAQDQVSNLHANYALLSCYGFDKETGFTEASADSAILKKLMVKNSNHAIIALDVSKLSQKGVFTSFKVEDINDIVFDKPIDNKLISFFHKNNIEVHF